ncbi:MAG TPA: beta-propeller fold lactonase family protein [Gemmatimonas sp.]|uniref:beta-propeller fold lactonase family protein n=1 Tax=Gemmatimonas sp. TaxID=1962908 RepID=UPI002EDA346D
MTPPTFPPESVVKRTRLLSRPTTALSIVLVSALALTVAFTPLPQQRQGAPRLYVENTESGDITVISIPDHKVLRTIPASLLKGHPDDVILSKDGRTLFVNLLDRRVIQAIDTGNEKLLWELPVPGEPHHLALARGDSILLVPLFSESAIVAINVHQKRIVGRVETAPGPHAIRVTRDGKRAYVGSLLGDRINIVDLVTMRVTRGIEFSEGIRPFELSPDEKEAYVQLSKLHGFQVVNLKSGQITHTVNHNKVAIPDPLPWPHTVNHGMALTRDGKTLVLAGSLEDAVYLYDATTMRQVARIPVDKLPGWITLSPDERFAYASNRGPGANTVSVIDIAARKEVARIKVGKIPQRMTTGYIPAGR